MVRRHCCLASREELEGRSQAIEVPLAFQRSESQSYSKLCLLRCSVRFSHMKASLAQKDTAQWPNVLLRSRCGYWKDTEANAFRRPEVSQA